MAWNVKEIETYLTENKSVVLATVDQSGNPQLRHLGGYGVDGLDVYFLTGKTTDKVGQIENHPEVALLFQHEGQVIPNLKSITLYGKAIEQKGDAFTQAAELIKKRRPQLVADAEKSSIYKVSADKVKILDFSSQPNVEVIEANKIK